MHCINRPHLANRAFSLVELSIVLVILGLLVGGVLSGQSLIRAAELRAVSTEYSRYIAASQSFRDKYFAIPGDMTNATRFWGDDNAACPDAAVANGTPGTCNGDGDGTLEYGAGGATAEMFQFWKQLALAGLIEGSYSGLSGAAAGQVAVHGTNAPTSKLNNAGWATYYIDIAGHAFWTTMNYYNELHIGADGDGSSGYAGVIKPEEAWNIDTKLDDGKPQRGSVIAIGWDTCTDAANATDLNGNYALTTSSNQCALAFPRAF